MLKAWHIIVENDVRLDKMMHDSLVLYDQALYYQRQSYFESKQFGKIKTYSYNELWNIVKHDEAYTDTKLDISPKTYAIRQVSNNWFAFIKALMAYKKNPDKFHGKPKMPNYLYKRKNYNIIQFDKTRFRKINKIENSFYLPCSDYKINVPKQIKFENIRQVTIQKFYGKTRINIIFEDKETKKNNFDSNSAIGIDIGVNNLCAITSNDKAFSYVINGRPLKSMNQYFNKLYAETKSILEKCNKSKTSKKVERLCRKRYNKIDNYLNNVSKKIIDLCIEHNINTIYIGHNPNWKQESKMSKQNNQNFVQIPFNKLIDQLKHKASRYIDLNVVVVEESYTSKVDHLAFESLEHHEEYSGKRIKRGLFMSSTGKLLNADINGSIGILRKGKAITDEQLLLLRDRGDVVSPAKLVITCK